MFDAARSSAGALQDRLTSHTLRRILQLGHFNSRKHRYRCGHPTPIQLENEIAPVWEIWPPFALVLLAALQGIAARGQETPPSDRDERWSIHFQTTGIGDAHDGFSAPYSGMNSLDDHSEVKGSLSTTLFLGVRVGHGFEIYIDPEAAGGEGFSNVLGIAGFPNGEITRALSANPKPYIARAFIRQTWGLGREHEHVDGDANQLAGNQATSRLVLTVGKLSATDLFDTNSYNHDPRGQFMNWSLMDDGAFDYPADARGYTYGGVLEFINKNYALRVGSFAVAVQANVLALDRHFRRNNSEVADFELHPVVLGKPGKVEVLGFVTDANMGNYREALDEMPIDPNIILTRHTDTMKYGFALNAQQSIASDLGAFARVGWNDGKTEDWMFTEIDRTGQAGLQWVGKRWERPKDIVGIACVFNGVSRDHRDYLAAGGYGFIVGDGHLTYGKERILETYYAWNPVKFTTVTLDFQFVGNPGYNQDRGRSPSHRYECILSSRKCSIVQGSVQAPVGLARLAPWEPNRRGHPGHMGA